MKRVSIRRADFWRLERNTTTIRMWGYLRFQSAGRIFGVWNYEVGEALLMIRDVSIRRADFWRLEPVWIVERIIVIKLFQSAGRIFGVWNRLIAGAIQTERGVSIRRADFWRLELFQCPTDLAQDQGFNPPGGFLASGTHRTRTDESYGTQFQSAGRIFGVWNLACRLMTSMRFLFQSAGRIFGVWNPLKS